MDTYCYNILNDTIYQSPWCKWIHHPKPITILIPQAPYYNYYYYYYYESNDKRSKWHSSKSTKLETDNDPNIHHHTHISTLTQKSNAVSEDLSAKLNTQSSKF